MVLNAICSVQIAHLICDVSEIELLWLKLFIIFLELLFFQALFYSCQYYKWHNIMIDIYVSTLLGSSLLRV